MANEVINKNENNQSPLSVPRRKTLIRKVIENNKSAPFLRRFHFLVARTRIELVFTE
jgi:hypothetical protein